MQFFLQICHVAGIFSLNENKFKLTSSCSELKLNVWQGVEGKKPPFASSETLFSPGHTSLAELQVRLLF